MKHTIIRFQKKEMGGGKLSQKLIIVWFLIAFFVIGNVGQAMAVTSDSWGYCIYLGYYDGRYARCHLYYNSNTTQITLKETSGEYFVETPGLTLRRLRAVGPTILTINNDSIIATEGEQPEPETWVYKFPSKTYTGLVPAERYGATVYFTKLINTRDPGDVYAENVTYNVLYEDSNTNKLLYLYTDVETPSRPSFESIKDKSLTIKWTSANRIGTVYSVKRATSPSGPWDNQSIIATTTDKSYTDTGSGLIPETTYYYCIMATHSYIDQTATSSIAEVTTTADPAVAAAQEAASKAAAAQEAALKAQAASEKAESKASEAVELIKNLKTNFTDFEASFSPTIISVKGSNGATATKGNTFSVDVTASNAIYYRAGVNGNYTAWQQSPRINNISLPNSGVNTIEVQAKRSNAENTPLASGYITVFKLN